MVVQDPNVYVSCFAANNYLYLENLVGTLKIKNTCTVIGIHSIRARYENSITGHDEYRSYIYIIAIKLDSYLSIMSGKFSPTSTSQFWITALPPPTSQSYFIGIVSY